MRGRDGRPSRGSAATVRSRRSSRNEESSRRRRRGRAGSCGGPIATGAADRRARRCGRARPKTRRARYGAAGAQPLPCLGIVTGRVVPQSGRRRRIRRPLTRGALMQLTIHTLDTAPAESRSILEGIAADLGLVPNLAAVAAASPALLSGFNGLRSAVAATKLDPVLRELTGLTVGVAVDNRYGVAFHSTMLGNLGVDESEISAVREGRVPTSSSLAAAHALAREISRSGGATCRTRIGASRGRRLLDRGHPRGGARGRVRVDGRDHRQPRGTRRARRVPRASGVEVTKFAPRAGLILVLSGVRLHCE